MTTQNTETNVNHIQSMFNPQGSQDAIKTWASMNERMTANFVEAGSRSIEIVSNTMKEALSNLGEATQVRNDPADYAMAYRDFAQKQMDLLARITQDLGDMTQKSGTEATDLASETGKELSDNVASIANATADKVAANVKDATDKVAANADKAAATAKETPEKASSAAKKTA